MVVYFENTQDNLLSDKYMSLFTLDGKKFFCVYQYRIYRKALAFGNYSLARKVLSCKDVESVEKVERRLRVSDYENKSWVVTEKYVELEGVLRKFFTNKRLASKLMNYGVNDVFACCDKNINIGIGTNKKVWIGSNICGQALSFVRKELTYGF